MYIFNIAHSIQNFDPYYEIIFKLRYASKVSCHWLSQYISTVTCHWHSLYSYTLLALPLLIHASYSLLLHASETISLQLHANGTTSTVTCH